MRLIVMFDLPTGSKAERKTYARFRNFLIEDGFVREQFSIYSRILLTRESAAMHIERIRRNLPSSGVVTVFEMTEKQYSSRHRLLNTTPKSPRQELGTQLTLLI